MKSITKVVTAAIVAGGAFVVFAPTWMPVPRSAEEVAFPQNVQFYNRAELSDYNKAPPPLARRRRAGPRRPRRTRTSRCSPT